MKTKTDTTTRLHLSLNAHDIDASVSFYRDLLGVDPDKERSGFARFQVDDPPLALSIVARSSGAEATGPQRLSHLGFRVPDQGALEAARRRLVGRGRELREEPESRCCYALQDKFWVTDPDGNEWEFYQLLDDLDHRGEDSKNCCD